MRSLIGMRSFHVRMAQSVGSLSSGRRWREHRSKAQGEGASAFFTHMYWDLETTMTTFKNNIILRAHLEHSGLW